MKKTKTYGDYYLGLDIGTNSVGWAVTDPNYNLLKYHGKEMWGIHLFEEANTAKDRRGFRSARRRRDRQQQRIDLLQEIFSEEITKVDPGFYLRLEESKFHKEDKKIAGKYSIFNDNTYTDKEYYQQYPTIYHLRKVLMDDEEETHDIRFLYLALAQILKHRGHFLFNGEFKTDNSFDSALESFMNAVNESKFAPATPISSDSLQKEYLKEIKKPLSISKEKNVYVTYFNSIKR